MTLIGNGSLDQSRLGRTEVNSREEEESRPDLNSNEEECSLVSPTLKHVEQGLIRIFIVWITQ